jgi:hypothetical protein
MPTTESNCRAIAKARGYVLGQKRGRIEIRTLEGQLVHTATQWSSALKFIITAPRLPSDGPEAA